MRNYSSDQSIKIQLDKLLKNNRRLNETESCCNAWSLSAGAVCRVCVGVCGCVCIRGVAANSHFSDGGVGNRRKTQSRVSWPPFLNYADSKYSLSFSHMHVHVTV